MNKLCFILIMLVVVGCKQEPVGQQPIDDIAPGPVSNVKVENTPGGAVLTYLLPEDEDLLYVKANYSLKEGVMSEVRASMYSDTIKISGFADASERQVTIKAVDRSQNESTPLVVTVKPLEPPVKTIGETLSLFTDFGGVSASWKNPMNAEVSVTILKEDNSKEYVPIQTFYSKMAEGLGSRRGLDTITGKFGVYVKDRWGNRSEVKYYTLKPLYEVRFDRLKFKEVILPTDALTAFGWPLNKLWDDLLTGSNGFHTGAGASWPQWFTFDMGVVGKISRIIEYQRSEGNYPFSAANIKRFEVWGCQTLDYTGSWNGWTKLMDCTSIKPSGLPTGQLSAEDRAYAAAGEEFNCPLSAPKVRYLRIKVLENWSGSQYFHLMEIKVFGDPR